MREPLLSSLLEPTAQKNKKGLNRRRYRQCKSAPLAGSVPPKKDVISSIPNSDSNVGKVHPSFKKVALFFAVYLGLGAVCFYLVRNQIEGKKTDGILDAVYFCIVTMTTVGYGDLVPNSALTKLLACAFVFTGMALIGLVLSKAADYLLEKQEILLVNALRKKVGPSDILKEAETNRVKYKCLTVFVLLMVLIVAGTTFLATVEKLEVVDAFYCVCATITTLGYGDKSFSTKAGRAFAVVWILTSTISLAQFFLYMAELNTERRHRALVKSVLTRKVTNVDLEAADLDNDGVVDAPEFVLYKLKEMGKITEEDISLVMEEFEDLDVDQSGTLSASDIMLAQSSKPER
ncbi:hypothetical protein I3760_12G134200 [Carya illinoinensis]|uniref:Uncharacterized protein n=1 Tax=Carya illinoinensis TaxID=32201 RepID=A0A922DKE9_CARIL|nr:hypothetical protein I3760_12G134200 [Carya illinoinensis]KAG2678238.1 hypothetical protein I3760_12G134200 [Carya illinoinensis]KAG6685920.1 hypothetical protein I3842_12G136100 [Carya illinoinensis]KAG6685921.1 hypothetical protein I3842_12G136100 [Carya illinoinensis]